MQLGRCAAAHDHSDVAGGDGMEGARRGASFGHDPIAPRGKVKGRGGVGTHPRAADAPIAVARAVGEK